MYGEQSYKKVRGGPKKNKAKRNRKPPTQKERNTKVTENDKTPAISCKEESLSQRPIPADAATSSTATIINVDKSTRSEESTEAYVELPAQQETRPVEKYQPPSTETAAGGNKTENKSKGAMKKTTKKGTEDNKTKKKGTPNRPEIVVVKEDSKDKANKAQEIGTSKAVKKITNIVVINSTDDIKILDFDTSETVKLFPKTVVISSKDDSKLLVIENSICKDKTCKPKRQPDFDTSEPVKIYPNTVMVSSTEETKILVIANSSCKGTACKPKRHPIMEMNNTRILRREPVQENAQPENERDGIISTDQDGKKKKRGKKKNNEGQ